MVGERETNKALEGIRENAVGMGRIGMRGGKEGMRGERGKSFAIERDEPLDDLPPQLTKKKTGKSTEQGFRLGLRLGLRGCAVQGGAGRTWRAEGAGGAFVSKFGELFFP